MNFKIQIAKFYFKTPIQLETGFKIYINIFGKDTQKC